MRAAAGDIPPADALDVAAHVKRLDKLLGGGDVYEQLVSLGESWRSGDWRPFLADLRRLRQRHGKTHATALQRIAELAWRRTVREDNYGRFHQLSALLPAPEMDPNWNCVRALFAERSHAGDAMAVENAWKAYAQDMLKLSCLRDDERAIAQGLIYLRLGRKFIEFAEHNALLMRTSWDDDGENADEDLHKLAANFLRHSIQVCPRLTDAYRELAKLHEELEDIDKAASVYEKLLKHLPDDFDAQLWLARYYLERDEPTKAEAHTEAARRLKPRDPQCLLLGWTQQVTSVRCLTKKRKLDEARTELQNLHKLRPPEVELFVLDLIAAAIEFKAKNAEAANQFVDLAVSRLEEPTPVWLQMSSIAARFSLSKEVKKEFDQHYKDAIQMRPTSRTAGLLGQYFAALKANQINYPGRATQERLAIAYIMRATDVRWEERDLTLACEWLYTLPRRAALLGNLTSLGIELFPNSPRLSFLAGADEMRRGPYYFNVEYAAECFRTAIEDSEQAALPLTPDQLVFARDSLSRLEELLGQGCRLGPGVEFGFDDEEEDDFHDDDDEYDDEYDDDGPSSLLPPGVGIEELIKTAPPSIIAALKEMAARNGMTIEEVVAKAFHLKPPSGRTPKAPPKPRRRGRAPQGNQTQFAFDDE
ncbi:MAG: tetratricopeptide repeat protein [Planctomycetia bacterium]|nr:tetratricopeptide repeat protein [Planctomycetia bacterium]